MLLAPIIYSLFDNLLRKYVRYHLFSDQYNSNNIMLDTVQMLYNTMFFISRYLAGEPMKDALGATVYSLMGSSVQFYLLLHRTLYKTKLKRTRTSLLYTGLGIRSFQKNTMFLRSFLFFIKECSVLCVLFPSL